MYNYITIFGLLLSFEKWGAKMELVSRLGILSEKLGKINSDSVARKRINKLFDEGSFIELDAFAFPFLLFKFCQHLYYPPSQFLLLIPTAAAIVFAILINFRILQNNH